MYNISSSSPKITNCTFYYNFATPDGIGGIYSTASSPKITNCIIWANRNIGIGSTGSGTSTVTYSDVQGTNVYPGTGNISTSPRFVDSTDFDGADNIFGTADDGLALKPTSAAINKGRNGALPARITTDITGASRIQQGTVDMGAYESPYVATAGVQQVQATATVQEEIPAAVKVYPNPASDRFTVQLTGPKGTKGSIELVDINSRILEQRVISFTGKANVQTEAFSVSAQPPGVYFVRVQHSEGVKTFKVIVAR